MFGKVAFVSIGTVSLVAVLAVVVLSGFLHVVPSHELPAQVPPALSLTTEVWGIFDPKTGTVLTGNNIHERQPIASVTKLFTAEVALTSEKRDENLRISYDDVSPHGRAGKLTLGDTVTVYELVFPMLIESSNDSAEAIRRHLGDEFAGTIRRITESLSLSDTVIVDASGLDLNNVSTVADLSLYSTHLKRTQPHIFDITQLPMYIDVRSGYINNNPARAFVNFTGGKHGYLPVADRTFVGTFTIPHSNKEVGIVLLKSNDLTRDLESLLAYSTSLIENSDIITR